MKTFLERKILAGFIINIVIVIALAWIVILRFDGKRNQDFDHILNWAGILLFSLLPILLTTVYFILRTHIRTSNTFQNSLSHNRQLLQSIIDNTSNPISVKKISGEYVLVNNHFETLFNNTKDEIIGKMDHDVLPEQVAETYRSSDMEVFKARKELMFEETIPLADGDHTYIAVKFPIFDVHGKVEAVGDISIDITDRKKLEESFKQVSTFFNITADIMAIVAKGKFVKVNPAIQKILGYYEDELDGKSLLDFVYIADRNITREKIIDHAIGSHQVKLESRWIHKNQSIKWLEWNVTYDNTSKLMFATARDITEKKDKELSLVIAEKFFTMSYDLLAVIKDNRLLKVNPAFTRTLGRTKEEMYSEDFLDLVHTDDIDIIHGAMSELMGGNHMVNFRVRMQAKSGSFKYLDWTMTFEYETQEMFGVARDVTTIIENEESLKTVNSFFEMSFDGFFVAKERKIIKINPAFTRILGYTQADLNNLSILDLIHPNHLKIASERMAKRLKGESVESNVIYKVLCKDGSWKWLESVINADTKTGTLYAVLQDITQKRQNDKELSSYIKKLKEDEQQIEAIFEGAPDPVVAIDQESIILKWNKMAEMVFGWTSEEAIGKPLYELTVPEKYRELHKKGIQDFLETGTGWLINKSIEVEVINKKGEIFPVSLTTSPINFGERQIFIGFVRDISETKKALMELHENEEKLRLIIENISEGVMVVNSQREIVMVNDMATLILDIEEEIEEPFNLSERFELYHSDRKTIFPSQNLPMERALAGENTNDVDLFLLNDKQRKRVLMSGRPLVNQDHKVVAAVVTIKDISKFKQLEEDLKNTEKKYRQLIGYKSG